jgi:hypothetical protein
MKPSYAVALYTNGKYAGCVGGCTLRLATKAEARVIARRYVKSHAGLYDYRAVEFTRDGYLCWEDDA